MSSYLKVTPFSMLSDKFDKPDPHIIPTTGRTAQFFSRKLAMVSYIVVVFRYNTDMRYWLKWTQATLGSFRNSVEDDRARLRYLLVVNRNCCPTVMATARDNPVIRTRR
jgi:hypothetical protein